MDYHSLLRKIELYTTDSFSQTNLAKLAYHNLKHTQSVVFNADQIAQHYQLSERDNFIVLASAWLHDLGYATQRTGHEASGAIAAGVFLASLGVTGLDIESIKGCIVATQLPQKPNNLLEDIVCDADLYHLGVPHFWDLSKLLRKEEEEANHKKIDKREWRDQTIKFLETHKYHTDFAKMLLDAEKQKNLHRLKEKSEDHLQYSTSPAETLIFSDLLHENKITGKKHGKGRSEKPERSIETMFRINAANHLRLSYMADNKAHIMITVNSIILSAIITLLLRKLDASNYLMIPSFMLLITSVATIAFAVLATRPALPHGLFSKKDLNDKKVNLLFFGNFYRMSLPDYQDGMNMMMEDKAFLYGSLIMDSYSQGIVLGRKYRLLRTSYSIFMFGLIFSVFAFIVASIFNK
jgi:predicted metal-dependent HD superfamily phosphohydrolase